MVRDIRTFLINRAKLNQTVTYGVMNDILELGLNFKNKYDSKVIGDWLDEISEYEFSKGRPMLSSLVIRKDDKRQGDGFYVLYAKLYGGTPEGVKRDKKLERLEIQKCYDYWSKEKRYIDFKSDF